MTAPNRRWSFSLRTVFVIIFITAGVFWTAINVNWLYQRNFIVDRMRLPVDGEQRAPWPLWLVGARGFARVTIEVQPEQVAEFEAMARDRSLQVQKIYPEAEVVVKAKQK